jgi:hypothetical protein
MWRNVLLRRVLTFLSNIEPAHLDIERGDLPSIIGTQVKVKLRPRRLDQRAINPDTLT